MKNKVHFLNDLMIIEIPYKGKVHLCFVDAVDSDVVYKHSWHYSKGYANASRRIKGKRESVLLHRLICEGDIVDHKNLLTLDNRKSNLRSVSSEINSLNTPNLTGVSYNKGKAKWHAYKKVQGKRVHLGYFNSEKEARDVVLFELEQRDIISARNKVNHD